MAAEHQESPGRATRWNCKSSIETIFCHEQTQKESTEGTFSILTSEKFSHRCSR